MVYWRELLVREDDRVTFLQLSHPRVYNDFMRFVKLRLAIGHSDLEIAFGEDITWFPNACVPIAGAIQKFTSQGVKFKYSATPDYLVKAHFADPLAVSTNQELVRVPLGKLWLFRDSDEINTLVNAYVREVQRQVVCESEVDGFVKTGIGPD